MILFLSDTHLDIGTADPDRRVEADLVACLRHFDEDVEALYLLGDIFDAYIEYPSLLPKGLVRFQGLLASWTDRGVPVTYFAGNHDPWHRDYFGRELGVRVVFDDLCEPLYGNDVYLTHGDGLDSTARWYNRLKPILRHPVPVWCYTTLLPGDLGFRLARWYNRTLGVEALRPDRIDQLRAFARHTLIRRPADLVVLGHSHQAELTVWPEGTYLNPGSWLETRTLGLLDAAGPALVRWNGADVEPVSDRVAVPVPAADHDIFSAR